MDLDSKKHPLINDQVTKKRWNTIVMVLYYIMYIALFYIFAKYLLLPLFPFLFAFFIAYILQRPIHALEKKKLPKKVTSVVLALLVYAAVLALIAVIGYAVYSRVRDFIPSASGDSSTLSGIVKTIKDNLLASDLFSKLPENIVKSISGWFDSFQTSLKSEGAVSAFIEKFGSFSEKIKSAITSVPTMLISSVVGIIATCFITVGFDDIKAFIKRQYKTEESLNKARTTKRVLTVSLGKIIRAYLLIMLITGSEVAAGLIILSAVGIYDGGNIAAISIGTAIIDIIPVLGTGTVLIPWAIYEVIIGNYAMALGLIIMYVIITVVRQYIEPKLVASQVGMSPVVSILAMYIGARFFGILGFFVVPLTCIVIKLLNDEGVLHMFKTKDMELKELAAEKSEADNENGSDIAEN